MLPWGQRPYSRGKLQTIWKTFIQQVHIDNLHWVAVGWSPAYTYSAGWRNAKTENGACHRLSWISHNSNWSFNVQPLCLHLNFSDLGADCYLGTRASRWLKSGTEESFFCRSRIDFIHICHSLYRFGCCFFCMKANQTSRFSHNSWSNYNIHCPDTI